jgi:pantetheine-phosphate adenylyltransferase
VATALYPGSFDPLHLGHLSVIRKAATMFDHVVVAVIGNPDKSSGMFTVADRIGLIRAAAASLPNVTCVQHHGLTVDAVQQTGSDVIIRTGHKDQGDEWSMLAMNELVAGTRTCFVPPDPAVASLSSSLVRSLTRLGRVADAIKLVPPPVARALAGVGPH